MIDHSSCDHPRTSKDRAACRKAKGAGKVHSSSAKARVSVGNRTGRVLTWDEANATGQIDETTLDDRIRDSRRKPAPSPLKVSKVDPESLR